MKSPVRPKEKRPCKDGNRVCQTKEQRYRIGLQARNPPKRKEGNKKNEDVFKDADVSAGLTHCSLHKECSDGW
jgi:hypothetical protein